MQKKIISFVGGITLSLLLFATQAQAAVLYSQSVALAPGWNVVSTPRVLDSHSFSATESSSNFDIYVLDASNTSGWSTMSSLSQTEFTPLYGYFVNNKTGVNQILTFNYKSSTTPNERLFSRAFAKSGWYSLGVANPTYTVNQGAVTLTDTNNPTNILSSLQSTDYNMAVDFTAGNFASNADSVAVSSTWDARSISDGINKLNDFRDTKGYAVYILNTSSLYSGFQNDSVPQCLDGVDNDGDGFVDFPADDGCINSTDNDESLPIAIGTIAASNSSYDPGSVQSKEIGTTGYKFTAIRLTAGSAEDVRLKSVRFYQNGSVSASDLSNVQIYVNGSAYATTVSSDGKYYSANFGSGVVIAKGLSKDIWIAGDITGSGAAGRTIDFDIQKNTDIDLSGETSGQSVVYVGTVNGTVSTSTPAVNGYTVTISQGSITSVTKATSVAAQNIAVNLANQVLGGYEVDITGEAISVQSQTLTVATSSGSGRGLLTIVSLYDQNGSVIAGPVDAVYASTTTQTVTFTDTVTYPVGKHTYTLKGKVASTIGNGTVYTATVTTWSSITGQITGNTITSSTLGVVMNAMTVKTAALAIAMSTTPAVQTIVAGGTGVTFANIQFDASQSGEDVRFSSISLTKSAFTGLSTCQLFDGATALNTGSNVLNPASTGAEAITFDSSLTVAKNTVKTLTLKCNVASSATGAFTWTVASTPTVTGVTSGSTVTATGTPTSASATQTIGASSLMVSTSPSSPSYIIASAGSTGNTVTILRFRATNESVNLSRIGLKLTNTASSSASDIAQVSIWDGATMVGTATFAGVNATSTLSSSVVLPKDADKDLTVKVDLAQIGSSQPGTQGALIALDYNATDTTGTQGTGTNSGMTINASGSTAVSGVRLFKSFPTFALDTINSSGVADGKLMRFKVTANANGGVGINQFKFAIATTSATATDLNLFGYTDSSYSSPISGFVSGQIASSNANASGAILTISPSTIVEVPAGTTQYFELRGTVAGVTTGSSVTTTLSGDSAYPSLATNMGTFTSVASSNLVWSPNATTTSTVAHTDWTNGYGVAGLPSSGLIQTRSN